MLEPSRSSNTTTQREPSPGSWRLIAALVPLLPTAVISRLWGYLARLRRPGWLVAGLKRVFVRATGIDMQEADLPLTGYATLEDLFVRRLKPGQRPLDTGNNVAVSPVDGIIGQHGLVENGTLLQIKGKPYRLDRLLDDDRQATRFEHGYFVTIYLAPHNYHRIHAPITGVVAEATLIPGRLLPVFPASCERVDELFCRNERLISYLDNSECGRLAVVKVGATLVGRMSVTYDPALRTNKPGQTVQHRRYDPGHQVIRGEELGAFELGSTIVLVAEPGRISFAGLKTGTAIRMGQALGVLAEKGVG